MKIDLRRFRPDNCSPIVLPSFLLYNPCCRATLLQSEILLFCLHLPGACLLSSAMSSSVSIEPSINDPWPATLDLSPINDPLGVLDSMSPALSAWGCQTTQDLCIPGLELDSIRGGSTNNVPPDILLCHNDLNKSSLPAANDTHSKNKKAGVSKPVQTAKESTSRERLLERNRQAASRCRQKRKEHMQLLESRFKKQLEKHQQLQSESRCLRLEILSLKNEVLKHAYCTDNQVSSYLQQMVQRVSLQMSRVLHI